MKKLTLFLVASVMLSSTFLSASCGDDDDDPVVDELKNKADEWASDNAKETSEAYYLYEYDGDLAYEGENGSNANPGTTTIPGNIDYKSVDAKAQILTETDITKFDSIDEMVALEVKGEIDPATQNCYTAAILLARIQMGQLIAIEVNGKKIVAKATNIDQAKLSVHLKGYALVPRQ
ncbi:MAG: hypothetical protein J5882_03365 [Bacteroidales bacterium]|nr:hypothetical protein [Bacteroidales bacterium]